MSHVLVQRGTLAALCALAFAPSFSSAQPFNRVIVDTQFAGDVKAVGDFNGDGYTDFALGGYQMAVYQSPTWSKQVIATAIVEFSTDMQAADVDNDGDLDLVTCDGSRENNVIWLENPRFGSSPTWVRHTIGSHGDTDWGHDVQVGDLDRDGRLDVVVRRNQTSLFFQDAAGSWTRRILDNAAGEGVALGDIDGDGDLDMVLPGVWLESPANPRTGAWVSRPVASGYHVETGAVVVDINRDSRPDIVFAQLHQRGKIAWYEAPVNPLIGTWTERILDPSMASHKLNIGDLNGDGLLDIVAGMELAELSIYLQQNTPTPTFSKQILSTTGLHNQRLLDFDNDGDLDIAGSNYLGNPPVEYWENRRLIPDQTVPGAASGLAASALGPTQVSLNWLAAIDNVGVTGYRVYRCQGDACDPTTEIANVSGLSHSDIGAPSNALLRYSVRAYDAAGNQGAFAAAVTVQTPPVVPVVGVSVAPNAVALLASGTQQFTATVTGTANTAVTWTLAPEVGTISPEGLYTAPSVISSVQSVAVNAISVADPTKWAVATVTLNPPPPLPEITSFTATPASIPAGQSSTLNWSATGTSLTLNPGGVDVTGTTSRVVTPSSTTTYALVAGNGSTSVEASTLVTVTPPPPAITSLTATPASIQTGQSSTINWIVTGATSLTLNPGGIDVTGTTSRVVTPSSTTTYTLVASDGSTTVNANATVAVTLPVPVITSLTASPASVQTGQSSTLNWVVTGATSLTLNPGAINVTGTSSLVVTPSGTTTYTLVASDGTTAVEANTSVTVTVPPPVITSLTATPASIQTGQSSTLNWSVTGATSLTLNPGGIDVTGTTSRVVTPASTTTYTLVASNGTTPVSATSSVTVVDPPPPVITTLSATPASIQSGQSSTLTWVVTGATILTLNPGGIDVTGTTSRVVTPASTTTYTLIASNGTTSVNTTRTVTVTAPTPPSITSFTASPTSMQAGQSSTLNWVVTGATSLTLNPGGIDVTGTTARAVTPTSTTTYTLVASNGTTSVSSTRTITITAPVITSFTGTPTTIPAGQSSTLNWVVTGATSLTLNPGGIIVTGTTSRVVTPTATTTYRLVASNGTTSVTRNRAITVTAAPPLAITSFTAAPASVQTGQSSTLSWVTTGATSLTLNPGGIVVTGTTSRVVTPESTTTYTLVASNGTASVNSTGTVTVTTPPPPPPPGSGLMAFWPFEEGSGGSTSDASGNGKTGTINNAPWLTAGRSGRALDFTGSNSYVNAGAIDVPGSALTISAWIKADSYPSGVDPRIVSKATGTAEQNHFMMLSVLNGTNKRLRLRLKTNGTTKTLAASSGNLPVNQWVHVAATYDGTTARLYLNGAQVGSVAMTGTINTDASVPMWIGANPVGGNGFDGAIDQVRIYNRALTVQEIQAFFQAGN